MHGMIKDMKSRTIVGNYCIEKFLVLMFIVALF